LRVAIVVRSLKVGGMERAAINLSEAFVANGHEAHLIYLRAKDKALEPNSSVHLHHFNLDKAMKLTVIGFFWNIFAKLISIIIRESYFLFKGMFTTPIFHYKLKQIEKRYGKFDLILLRGQGTFETLWATKDTRIILQKVSMAAKYGNPLRNFYQRCLHQDKNILCNSIGVKDEFLKVMQIAGVKPRRVDLIPNLIHLDKVKEKALQFKPDINAPYIVNVGRFTTVKRIPLLLESYAYAKEHLKLQHKLVLVGDGHIRKTIEDKIKSLNIEDDVFLTGSINNPYPWIKNADLFVFTSFSEGLPNVLLESLVCETPIVATKGQGGTLDIMKNELAQFLVNFDKKEIATKIVETLQNKPKIDFKKHVIEFEPTTVIDKYITTYLS